MLSKRGNTSLQNEVWSETHYICVVWGLFDCLHIVSIKLNKLGTKDTILIHWKSSAASKCWHYHCHLISNQFKLTAILIQTLRDSFKSCKFEKSSYLLSSALTSDSHDAENWCHSSVIHARLVHSSEGGRSEIFVNVWVFFVVKYNHIYM